MYHLRFLYKENDLNKIIRKQKKSKEEIAILFVSLWDDYSNSLVEELVARYSSNEEGTPLYIVDSFHMPHSFVIYKTTKLPHLVSIGRGNPQSEDYLSRIYQRLLPEAREATE